MIPRWLRRDGRTTHDRGADAESFALEYLQKAGLRLLERNYKTPGRGGGEIDLIMQTPDDVVVFVEVRARSNPHYGGAAASIHERKRRRIIFAAQQWLLKFRTPPPCRFDVIALDGEHIEWLRAAFDAS